MTARATRIRAGLYRVRDASGRSWTIEERRENPAYGTGWMWFASCDDALDLAMDPFFTLREAKAAVENTRAV